MLILVSLLSIMFDEIIKVLSGMVERGKGTILFTGCSASLNGIVGYSELCKYQLSLLLECVFINFVVGGGVVC